MGKYVVISGQNIFDVALTIYGSIEGITDLLMNNNELSLNSVLALGEELIYTDDYIIDPDIVAYNRLHKIVPANGERHVYPKEPTLPQLLEIHVSNTQTYAHFVVSGSGNMEIDWGDNSQLMQVEVDMDYRSIRHTFDTKIGHTRKIRIYGENNLAIAKIDFSFLNPSAIFLYRPLYVECFILQKAHLELGFLSLFEGTYEVDLSGTKTSSLLPLLPLKDLMTLNLTDVKVQREALDTYLIGLVNKYGRRRNCHVKLTLQPSGVFKEPAWDENFDYIYTSGMEAIWVITHEPAWNEAGFWKFDIEGTIYMKDYEQDN